MHYNHSQIFRSRHDMKLKVKQKMIFKKWRRLKITPTCSHDQCVFYLWETDFWWPRLFLVQISTLHCIYDLGHEDISIHLRCYLPISSKGHSKWHVFASTEANVSDIYQMKVSSKYFLFWSNKKLWSGGRRLYCLTLPPYFSLLSFLFSNQLLVWTKYFQKNT